MASLSVRRIDEKTYERLRQRAARHGVSMEEEVRRILERTVAAPGRLSDLARECFGPEHGIALELEERLPHEPVVMMPTRAPVDRRGAVRRSPRSRG